MSYHPLNATFAHISPSPALQLARPHAANWGWDVCQGYPDLPLKLLAISCELWTNTRSCTP